MAFTEAQKQAGLYLLGSQATIKALKIALESREDLQEMAADIAVLQGALTGISMEIPMDDSQKPQIQDALVRLNNPPQDILDAAKVSADEWSQVLDHARVAFDIPPAIDLEVSKRILGTPEERAALAAWAQEQRARLNAQRPSGVQAPEDDEARLPREIAERTVPAMQSDDFLGKPPPSAAPEMPAGPAAVMAVASAESTAPKLDVESLKAAFAALHNVQENLPSGHRALTPREQLATKVHEMLVAAEVMNIDDREERVKVSKTKLSATGEGSPLVRLKKRLTESEVSSTNTSLGQLAGMIPETNDAAKTHAAEAKAHFDTFAESHAEWLAAQPSLSAARSQ